jgi:hypothetical protein
MACNAKGYPLPRSSEKVITKPFVGDGKWMNKVA